MRAKKILLGMSACLMAVGLIAAKQESGKAPSATPEQKRQIAVSVMRIINTAEMTHRVRAGRYAALEEFAPTELDTSRARYRNPAIPTIDPRAGKDAVAGFELRITVALDGNS